MNSPSSIETIVSRRVRRMRVLRVVLSNTALASVVVVLALWGIGREVWVARILQNAPRDLTRLPNFYLAALRHTRLAVQILSLVTLAALVELARQMANRIMAFITPVLG